MASDTIFALSTGGGAAGIAIIRISGPRTKDVLREFAGDVPPARHAVLRQIADPATGSAIDSGVILFFPGPNSFTGEDLAELQVHGSLAVIRQLLRCLGEQVGVRAADAGEFTYRAFLNGKMDLVAVEALGDLLSAETEAQARLTRIYQRNLRLAAATWRESLLSVLGLTEASIDFVDEGDIDAEIDSIAEQEIIQLQQEIRGAISGLATAERIRRGYRIAILGPTNAGKSSLINALAQRDVAITSPIPGTTRDTIEVHLDLKGLPIVLIDTAGLRESTDELESEGIMRAYSAARDADLVLWLSPANCPMPNPFEHSVLVLSKSDTIDSPPISSIHSPVISVKTSSGLDDVIAAMHQRAALCLDLGTDTVLAAHTRQAGELLAAAEALGRSLSFGAGSLELRAEELRIAQWALDRLTGRISPDEILGAIFSRFCIGK